MSHRHAVVLARRPALNRQLANPASARPMPADRPQQPTDDEPVPADQRGPHGRPLEPATISFDDLAARRPIPKARLLRIVPLEVARAGDAQVRVGNTVYAGAQPA